MYSISAIKSAIGSPRSIIREFNRLCHTHGRTLDSNPIGTNVFDEDWDNLIILDACRYDYFAHHSDLPGELQSRYSLGTQTREFAETNFTNRRLHDSVYVTANSWYHHMKSDLDSEVYKLIDLHWGDADGTYHSEEFKVVLPDVVTEHAARAAKEFTNKRLIVHYLQPHHPFIGPTGRKYFDAETSRLWETVAAADVPPYVVRQAYRENLELALSAVKDLLPALEGKTVITADHGEMLGERHDFLPMRDFGHPPKMYNEALTKVPWHVYQDGTRRRIVPEEPEENDEEMDVDALERRLEDLGYKLGHS